MQYATSVALFQTSSFVLPEVLFLFEIGCIEKRQALWLDVMPGTQGEGLLCLGKWIGKTRCSMLSPCAFKICFFIFQYVYISSDDTEASYAKIR